MLHRTAKTLRVPLSGLVAVVALIMASTALGQMPAPAAPAQFDPSDVYFQGYLATRSADELEGAGDFLGALDKLKKADQLFQTVRRYYPEWKPEMVDGRCGKTTEAIAKVRGKAEEQHQKNRNAVAELEGGVKQSGQLIDPAKNVVPLSPGILEVEPLAARRLADAEAEVKRLSGLINLRNSHAAETDQEQRRNASRLGDLSRQRDALQSQLKAAENTIQSLRNSRAAEANQDRRHNDTRLEDLTRQRDALQAQLKAAESDVQSLRNSRTADADQEQRRNASRLGDLSRQRDALQADLKAAENNVQSLRARLAASPLQKDMQALNQRIGSLEQERQAMSMALTQSSGAHSEAMARIATLETDLRAMQQKHSDLQRDLNTERNVANSVVSGQLRQLKALEKELQQKNTELAAANQLIHSLMNQLSESHEAFAQLRDERDSLLQERDQMAALLKLNEAGRIQDLIEQNMSLAKNLREANEKVDRLNRESNADKDAITDALRDLAIAKSQINRLHQDKRDQDKRLTELEQRLKNEEQALATGKIAADPAEVEILRDIIKRQLRVQERRRQARDLLVDAARELGAQDERLAKAIELFDAQEIALTPEEQKLIANKQVDGEFVSPFARDRVSVGQATAQLNQDISVFERTAEKSFIAGRLLPTRELYEMILDQHPGHTPSLCKLGVVHLKLDEPEAAADSFRRAVEMDPNNPYAFRMLGFSLMKLGDLPAAEQAARRSVDLAPNDAKNHMLLATLCYRLGRTGEAESHFKGAITADPLPSEPYYNIALICSRDGRIQDAKNFYQQALERGALPDSALEDSLAKQ